MPRQPRVWYPGATYHIMQRGVRKDSIFILENDFFRFLQLLKKAAEDFHCIIHAYCLMTNHYHLLLETSDQEIWKFMKGFPQRYAYYYNKQYNFQGHLFEGRYRSCLVTDDAYFLQTGRYIHLNPVKARIVENPQDYKWSSYSTYLGISDDDISYRNKTLQYFEPNDLFAYKNFIEDKNNNFQSQEESIRKSMLEDEFWLPR